MALSDPMFAPGLGESQRTLLELLKRGGETTLADLEAGLELARETLRDHLKALSAQGLVERAGVRREGPGRPHVLYRLTAAGQELFPHREGELLKELATFLLEAGHEVLLGEFFEARVQRKREALHERVAGLEGSARLEEVVRILSEEGFLAEADTTGSAPLLRLCHCPLRDVVAVSRLPCRAEMALVEELLGTPLVRESFMPEGGHTCSYSLVASRRSGEALETTEPAPEN